MAYTTIDKPSDYFNTVLRSGLYGGSDTAFTVGFQPDWIWDKRRSGTSVHALFDSVRGFGSSGKVLYSNTADAEATNALIKSVSSTGFTVTASSDNTGTLVDWCWKAGTSFTNDASATGIGTIDSTGSVNETAGFSIISYTGTGANGTIKHGLSTAPRMMIFKNRDEGAEGWFVYHESVGNTKRAGLLNENGSATTSSTFFQDTSPTSSIITLGSNHGCNGPDAMICYAFSERKGYSKFGSYTGNANADGPMIWCGFRPAWFLVKNTGASEHWRIYDNKRDTVNHMYHVLFPNESSAESTVNNASEEIDFLSNGVKIRSSAQQLNGSGHTLVFMAFAESPFVNSNGIPNNAR
jgi:hypothetical protein